MLEVFGAQHIQGCPNHASTLQRLWSLEGLPLTMPHGMVEKPHGLGFPNCQHSLHAKAPATHLS